MLTVAGVLWLLHPFSGGVGRGYKLTYALLCDTYEILYQIPVSLLTTHMLSKVQSFFASFFFL